MGRKQTKVKTLHDYTLNNLINLEQEHKSKYARRALKAVIMSYQGIHIDDIQNTIGVTRSTLLTYINSWNKSGLDSLHDGRGGSESSFTEEMFDEIRTILTTKDPREFNFISSVWTIDSVREHLANKFGRLYSYERTRQIIIQLGFSHKRGEYHPTLANPQKQIAFKKNAQDTTYCRKLY